MDEAKVKAFLSKLIFEERRWTSDLEAEAREIIGAVDQVAEVVDAGIQAMPTPATEEK